MDALDRKLLAAVLRKQRRHPKATPGSGDPGLCGTRGAGDTGLCGTSGRDARRRSGRAKRATDDRLRSHCLVLRASDSRLPHSHIIGHARQNPGQPWWPVESVTVWADDVRDLCAPVWIGEPGVTVTEAAKILGVTPNTIRNWARRGLVRLTRIAGKCGENRSHSAQRRWPVYNFTLVTTPRVLDPAGEVLTMPWGSALRDLARHVPDDLEIELLRVRREMNVGDGREATPPWGTSDVGCRTSDVTSAELGTRSAERTQPGGYAAPAKRETRNGVPAPAAQTASWFFICPSCGAWVYKLYHPTPVTRWNVQNLGSRIADRGSIDAEPQTRNPQPFFACRRCAGVCYESAEKNGTHHGKKKDPWDRFIRRLTRGELDGKQVRQS